MTTLIIGTVLGMVAMLLLMAVMKDMKKEDKEAASTPAPPMGAEERALMLSEFAGKDVPFLISDEVAGQASYLAVDWVEAYGTRYESIEQALSCPHLTKGEYEQLAATETALAELRNTSMSAKRHLEVKDMLDGKVYVYEPCKIKLDVDTLAARVAIEVTRNTDLSVVISSIYVSKLDVTAARNRYEFDMTNPDDAESFNLLVRENADYALEVKELALIEARIGHYNSLVKKGRIGQEQDGSITVFPPTPEEIKALREEKKEPVKEPLETAEHIKAAIEEFVSSSSL